MSVLARMTPLTSRSRTMRAAVGQGEAVSRTASPRPNSSSPASRRAEISLWWPAGSRPMVRPARSLRREPAGSPDRWSSRAAGSESTMPQRVGRSQTVSQEAAASIAMGWPSRRWQIRAMSVSDRSSAVMSGRTRRSG
ncbi:hypothetical protein ACFPN0_31880 [Kitasatospora cinereorecta]